MRGFDAPAFVVCKTRNSLLREPPIVRKTEADRSCKEATLPKAAISAGDSSDGKASIHFVQTGVKISSTHHINVLLRTYLFSTTQANSSSCRILLYPRQPRTTEHSTKNAPGLKAKDPESYCSGRKTFTNETQREVDVDQLNIMQLSIKRYRKKPFAVTRAVKIRDEAEYVKNTKIDVFPKSTIELFSVTYAN
uniref:Uncharacterized protein n=1 Tax=Heterorhabditis bacteriophora TaxID=37862 RepID=A0A1I7XSM6_HETBA